MMQDTDAGDARCSANAVDAADADAADVAVSKALHASSCDLLD